jgi:hypothetical protein
MGEPSAVIAGAAGRLLVACRGGRILSWETAPGAENVFWSHDDAFACKSSAELTALHGGMGGARVWFGPEYAYGWDGEPDTERFTNYVVQPDQDPGRYRIVQSAADCVTLQAEGRLHDYQAGRQVSFSLRRTIRADVDPGESGIGVPAGVTAFALAVENELTMEARWPEARIDVWQLAQFRVPALLGFPLRTPGEPEVYCNPTGQRQWNVSPETVLWRVDGTPSTKIGFSTRLSTGVIGAWLPANREKGDARLFIWKLPVLDGADYVDGPSPQRFGDQVTQAWDGFGFCELEYHSPAARPGGQPVRDRSILVVYQGPLDLLAEIARQELKIPRMESIP